jgi:hypothetical protein
MNVNCISASYREQRSISISIYSNKYRNDVTFFEEINSLPKRIYSQLISRANQNTKYLFCFLGIEVKYST